MNADWRRKIKQYKTIAFEASKQRIHDRSSILKILISKENNIYDRIDMIIDYFRSKYEGGKFLGLPLKDRLKLFSKYEGKCMWCGKDIIFKEITVEHIIPLSEGGTNEWDNLGCSCAKCNSSRDGIILDQKGNYKK